MVVGSLARLGFASGAKAPAFWGEFMYGLKPVPFMVKSAFWGEFMYGLKPVPFMVKSVPFTVKPAPFALEPVPFMVWEWAFGED